jgi:hypothetical protein
MDEVFLENGGWNHTLEGTETWSARTHYALVQYSSYRLTDGLDLVAFSSLTNVTPVVHCTGGRSLVSPIDGTLENYRCREFHFEILCPNLQVESQFYFVIIYVV